MLPDMISSSDGYYKRAYDLRRQASTMQRNTITWLKDYSRKLSMTSEVLHVLSVGCGDGELDFPLLRSLGASHTCICYTGLEPDESSQDSFQVQTQDIPNVEIILHGITFEEFLRTRQDNEKYDLVVLAHVLYYFPDISSVLQDSLGLLRENGKVLVLHQSARGVPEIQKVLLPKLRGNTNNMLCSDTVELALNTMQLKYVREDVDAYLDISEMVKKSEDGIAVMSFCLEADHREASDDTIENSCQEFVKMQVLEAEKSRQGGPFVKEGVSIFTIKG